MVASIIDLLTLCSKADIYRVKESSMKSIINASMHAVSRQSSIALDDTILVSYR